jgi:FAD/FMN-containing dehydrogenase
MPLRVRSGGHSYEAFSVLDNGLVIDVSGMNEITLDQARGEAVVGAGVRLLDLYRRLWDFGVTVPAGTCPRVGIAGLTLGGGIGFLSRQFGLTCDNVIAVEVVDAAGETLRASESEHRDLFWALRGGGGNFGIVTSFTFRLHELGPEVAFAATFYPLEELAEVLGGWRDFVTRAPNEVTSACVTITFPANPDMPEAVHDRPCAIIGGVYAGAADEGMDLMRPLRELGTPLFDMSGPTPYIGVQTGFDPLFPRGELRAYWKSQYVDELTNDAIDTIARLAQDRPAPLTLVNVFQMGGALAEVDPEDTAFATRSAPFMVSLDGMWTDPAADMDNVAWIRSAWRDVSRHGTGDVYLNFTGLADEAPSAGVDSAFGRNLRRLAEVKAVYDPKNFFRVNNNIAPAS